MSWSCIATRRRALPRSVRCSDSTLVGSPARRVSVKVAFGDQRCRLEPSRSCEQVPPGFALRSERSSDSAGVADQRIAESNLVSPCVGIEAALQLTARGFDDLASGVVKR